MKGYDAMFRDRLFYNVDRQRHGTQLKKKKYLKSIFELFICFSKKSKTQRYNHKLTILRQKILIKASFNPYLSFFTYLEMLFVRNFTHKQININKLLPLRQSSSATLHFELKSQESSLIRRVL